MELAWFIVTALSGLIVGLILGVMIASFLVRGHYTHIMTNQQQTKAQPVLHPLPRRPQYEEGYY